MGSSSSTSQSTSMNSQNVKERTQALYVQIRSGNKQNFYELFNFERYSSPSQSKVARAYRKLALLYHPDKNPTALKEECEGIMSVLVLAKDTLMNSKKKHRYDIALRKELGETDGWDTCRWLTKVFGSATFILGGSGLIIAGIIGAVPTGGASIAAGIAGSSALSAGISGAVSHYNDPEQPLSEFGKDFAVGAVQGAALGAMGAAVAPAVSGASTLAAKVAIYAGSGALSGITYKAIGDGSALAREKKTKEEMFSLANAKSYAKNALLGAALAGAVGALAHGASSASQLTDDAVTIGQQVKEQCREQFQRLMGQLKITESEAAQAIRIARVSSGLAVPAIMAGFVGDRAKDRFLYLPTACVCRQPRYMRLARGECTSIEPAPKNDLAFKSKVATPLTPGNCLQAYTQETPLYRNVNAALRSDGECLDEYAGFIWHTKSEIKSLMKAHGIYKGFSFRSVRLDNEQLDFYQVGRKFLWANFTSTTRNRDEALKFKGNALFEIDCNGEGMTYCVDVSHISSFPNEEEVLFFPYSGFIVKDVSIELGRIVIFLKTFDTLLVEEHNADKA